MDGWGEVKKCPGINKHAPECWGRRERCLCLPGKLDISFYLNLFSQNTDEDEDGFGLKAGNLYYINQNLNSVQLGGRICRYQFWLGETSHRVSARVFFDDRGAHLQLLYDK
ncbi:hypothetical protein H1C71_009048 [Ictidomys tridecemlineatus]|nr:hypothetical protein H1C71_009048 [Ictidomys tridecemlineatus]